MFRLCILLALASGCVDDATASDSQSATAARGSDHRPPPPEALDACATGSAGGACAFDIDGHHVTGTCTQGPADGPLACKPDHPPPPPETFDACASSAAGDACAFDIDGHHVTGTCRQGPDGQGPLGCAPDQPPQQP
jgi:hypothetical protein